MSRIRVTLGVRYDSKYLSPSLFFPLTEFLYEISQNLSRVSSNISTVVHRLTHANVSNGGVMIQGNDTKKAT